MITICISLSSIPKPKASCLPPSLCIKISLPKFNNNFRLLNPLNIFPVSSHFSFSETHHICSTPLHLEIPPSFAFYDITFLCFSLTHSLSLHPTIGVNLLPVLNLYSIISYSKISSKLQTCKSVPT